jgi:hypothetical protein
MAKRKLHGAALAAYNRKRGIGGHSKALAKRGSANVVVVRERVGAPAKKPAKKKGRRRHGGGSSSLSSKAWTAGAAAAWGWAKANKAAQVAKIPKIESIGLEATIGLALHFLAPKLPAGYIRKGAEHLSAATTTLAAYAWGRSNFASATVSGDDIGDMSGPLGDDIGDFESAGDDESGDDMGDDYE